MASSVPSHGREETYFNGNVVPVHRGRRLRHDRQIRRTDRWCRLKITHPPQPPLSVSAQVCRAALAAGHGPKGLRAGFSLGDHDSHDFGVGMADGEDAVPPTLRRSRTPTLPGRVTVLRDRRGGSPSSATGPRRKTKRNKPNASDGGDAVPPTLRHSRTPTLQGRVAVLGDRMPGGPRFTAARIDLIKSRGHDKPQSLRSRLE